MWIHGGILMTTMEEKLAAYERTWEFLARIGTIEVREFDPFGNIDGKKSCYFK